MDESPKNESQNYKCIRIQENAFQIKEQKIISHARHKILSKKENIKVFKLQVRTFIH